MRKTWMEANVTHESSCRIHVLNRNRPFCGTGNVFVFPALPYTEQSLNCTASIYQCHIFLCWKRGVFHEHSILFLKRRWGLSSRVLCLGKYASPCLPRFLSLSHILTVIPFPLSSCSVATCTSGCLSEISGESIWILLSIGPGCVTVWPKEACSLPWTLPLQSGCVELGSPEIDNVSRDSAATTVGFLRWEGFCQSTLRMTPVK